MRTNQEYPIGSPNKKWNKNDKTEWLSKQTIKRSYHDDVITKLDAFENNFDIEQYGALSYSPKTYPLFVLKTLGWKTEIHLY